MHRHITYYTQSIVCQGGLSNKFGRMQDLPRGSNYFFFWGGGLATRGVVMRLLGACFPEILLGMVQSGAFWSIFS